MNIPHAEWCTIENPMQNCFRCHMDSEKKKYGDSVQFYEWDTLTLWVDKDWNLSPQ